MVSVGIRELRQNASVHVAAAAAGERITITDRGRPVAALVPLSAVEHTLHHMLTAHPLIEPARPRRSFVADQRLAGLPLSADIDSGRDEHEPWTE
ncbi:MAG: type II toxin-antitoxin system prevent-host-death family antitoxin [Kineosporiaceae bacterium]